jgi:hypothetical protein
MRRKSPTSRWRRSMFSTRTPPERANSRPAAAEVEPLVADAAAAVAATARRPGKPYPVFTTAADDRSVRRRSAASGAWLPCKRCASALALSRTLPRVFHQTRRGSLREPDAVFSSAVGAECALLGIVPQPRRQPPHQNPGENDPKQQDRARRHAYRLAKAEKPEEACAPPAAAIPRPSSRPITPTQWG